MRLSVEEAFEKYGDRLFALAFSICRNKADADDVTQDTFIKYYTSGVEYIDENHLRAWLMRVAINRSKDLVSSFWHRNKSEWQEYMNELSFTEPEDSSLFDAVMHLPEKYRIAVHLFYYEEYSVREIAALLKTREGTVKSQLSRGRKLLKTMLTEEWNDDE